MISGSCLCGGVRFQIEGEIEPIQVCHCSQCRKAQGTPFATNAPVSVSRFQLSSGSELLREFESSPGKKRVFCARCGSPVFSSRDTAPGIIRIRVGLLDEPFSARPALHIYASSNCDWWPIKDELPQFPAAYDPAAKHLQAKSPAS